MQAIDLKLPPEITSWLFEGGTAWIEPLDPQPQNTPLETKYSPGSIVCLVNEKKLEAKIKTISTLRIKESNWQIIAQTGFPEVLEDSLSLLEKKYLAESFYNQFEKNFPGKLKKNPWVYFITVENIEITSK